MIILRQKKVIRVVIWAVAMAFILSIFIFGGSFFLDRKEREQEAEVKNEIDEIRLQEKAEEAALRANVVATFKGGTVTVGDVIDLYTKRLSPEFKRYFQGKEGKKKLVEQFALERLQLKFSEGLYPNLTGEVEVMIDKLASSKQAQGGMDTFLASQNLTMEGLRDMLRSQILISKREELVTSGKSAKTSEIEEYFEVNMETDFSGKKLDEVRDEIKMTLATTVTDEEFQQFYQEHLDRFRKPDEVLIKHIMVNPDSDDWKNKADAEITKEAVDKHYASICTRPEFKTRGLATIKHIFIDPRDGSRMARVNIPENRCSSYYGEHKEDFKTIDKRKVRQIFVDPRNESRITSIVVEESEITEYYDKNITQYEFTNEDGTSTKQPLEDARDDIISDLKLDKAEDVAKELAETIQEELSAGKLTFDEAVAKYSEGESKAQNGEIGYLIKGSQRSPAVLKLAAEILAADSKNLLKPIEQSVFSLAAGATSEVIESEIGFHLLKVEEIIPPRPQTYKEAKGEVEEKLRPALAWEDAFRVISLVFNKLREGADFSAMAVQYSELPSAKDGGEIAPFYLGKIPPDLDSVKRSTLLAEIASSSAIFPEIVESLLASKPGIHSEIIKTDKGYHLLELVSIELRPYLPIPLVRSEVRKDLIKTRARQNVESLLDSLRERILKGELTFEEAAKEYSEGKTAQEGGVMGWVKQEENLGDDPEKAKTFRNELASFSFRQVQGRFTPVTVLEQTVADRIFQMPAGGLTTKLESRYGLHLVTPAELRAGEPKPLDEVKEEIREALVSVFTEEQLKVYYEEHKETYKKPESEEYLPFVEKREEIEKALKKERQDRLIEAWLGEIKRGGQITIIHENLKHLEEL